MDTKICKDCLVDQPVANFTRNKWLKDGLNNRCKPCDNAHQMARINASPEDYKAKRLAYRNANREEYREYSRRAKANMLLKDPRYPATSWANRRAKDPRTFWAKSVMAQVKVRCKKKGLPYDIDWPYILSITPVVCPIFNLPLVFTGGRGGFHADAPSVDRIIPAEGYVRGNVVVISLRANSIKRDATLEELQAITRFYEAHCTANRPAGV
jgi:hypothetical protein